MSSQPGINTRPHLPRRDFPKTLAAIGNADTLLLSLRREGKSFAYIETQHIAVNYGTPGKDTLRSRYHSLKALAKEFSTADLANLRTSTHSHKSADGTIDWIAVKGDVLSGSQVGDWNIPELIARYNTL